MRPFPLGVVPASPDTTWAEVLPHAFPEASWQYPTETSQTELIKGLTSQEAEKHYAEVIHRYLKAEGFSGLRLGLSGPMGAGKTTLIQHLVTQRILEATSDDTLSTAWRTLTPEVTSPTFTRLHEYHTAEGLPVAFHADLYRDTAPLLETSNTGTSPETLTSTHHRMLHTFFPQFEEACRRFEPAMATENPIFFIEWPERLGINFALSHLDALLTIQSLPASLGSESKEHLRILKWHWFANA